MKVRVFITSVIFGAQVTAAILLASDSSATADDTPSTDYFPPSEAAFIAAVQQSQTAFANAQTEFQQGAQRSIRSRAICAAMRNSLAISQWTGKIKELTTNGDGKGVISIEIAPNITLKTWNNSLSDLADHTMIEPNSAIYQKMMSLQDGQWVSFNASFFRSKLDCARETSVTLSGSLTSPDFLVQFYDIGAPQKSSALAQPRLAPPEEGDAPVVFSLITNCTGDLITLSWINQRPVQACVFPR